MILYHKQMWQLQKMYRFHIQSFRKKCKLIWMWISLDTHAPAKSLLKANKKYVNNLNWTPVIPPGRMMIHSSSFHTTIRNIVSFPSILWKGETIFSWKCKVIIFYIKWQNPYSFGKKLTAKLTVHYCSISF